MGEYEDRYPDAYGRDEAKGQPPPREEVVHPSAPRQVRDVAAGPSGRTETPASWRHVSAGAGGAGLPAERAGGFRGIGPRGYRRTPERIYEDICDRLTDNPFIDASDIDVATSGTEIVLSGSVDSAIALSQAQQIAAEVVGVSHVHNRLRVRPDADRREETPGDQVNRAMGRTSTR
jgi:hypothetical protein